MTRPAIQIDHLSFRYRPGSPRVLDDVSLRLEHGVRCLLLGANGAGKTTLLRILAGRHLVPQDDVRVLGRAAFHDTSLAHDVSLLGGVFPFYADVSVEQMLATTPCREPDRRERLLAVLGVEPGWHMHEVSDGQRRRVQIMLGLLQPCAVLLMDEVTTDLDVIARQDLLSFLRDDAERRGTTVLYATHIFDGLEDWATHLCFMQRGRIARMTTIEGLVELAELRARGAASPLLRLVEAWMRAELAAPR